MITKREIDSIDKQYFNVIQAGGFTICIQSRNTKHYWHIVEEAYPTFRHFKVFHKHNATDVFHAHSDAANLEVSIERIIDHDRYQLNGRKPLL